MLPLEVVDVELGMIIVWHQPGVCDVLSGERFPVAVDFPDDAVVFFLASPIN